MNFSKQQLLIEQVDKMLLNYKPLKNLAVPQKGWVYCVRIALKMSLRQLGNRLKISPQSVMEIEEREANGSITLKTLKEAANALEMKLVYGFVSKNENLEEIIEKRAFQIATEIVLRTSNSMKLEDQENSEERLQKAIKNRTEEIKNTMPKYLWD